MRTDETLPREALVKMLDELPSEQVSEILDFAIFIKGRLRNRRISGGTRVRTVPAIHLRSLIGRVAWGGDALAETEGLCEGD